MLEIIKNFIDFLTTPTISFTLLTILTPLLFPPTDWFDKVSDIPNVKKCLNHFLQSKELESVNCINVDHSNLLGYNTDYYGFKNMILSNNIQLNNKKVDYIINLQGDEPMIDIDDVRNLYKQAINNKSEIATLACKLKNKLMLNNSDIVKVVTEKKLSKYANTKAKTFLRKVLDNNQANIYHHIGIYLYKVSILEKFVNLKQTENEISQKLEQLRAMENNISIDVFLANSSPIGVDTEEDYLEIKKLMEYKN